jgi:lysophospholipase L1-like esterase
VNRTGNTVLAVLAVLELSAAVYVVTHNDAPKQDVAGSVPAQQQQAPVVSSSSTPPLGVAATNTSRGPVAGQLVVAFLGDDWTAGAGASRKGKRFTSLVASALGMDEQNFGIAGTGYAKASATGGAYGTRLGAVVASDPQVVVVSGGRNDRSDAAATVADAAQLIFAHLHTELPNAVLIAVAPFWGDSDLPPEMAALSSAVEQGVTDAGGSYLDLADPIHGHPDFMADDADPNDQGYAAIATALQPLLAPVLPR